MLATCQGLTEKAPHYRSLASVRINEGRTLSHCFAGKLRAIMIVNWPLGTALHRYADDPWQSGAF
jgi:hypothetical protein